MTVPCSTSYSLLFVEYVIRAPMRAVLEFCSLTEDYVYGYPILEPVPSAVQRWHELHKAAMAGTDTKTLPSQINEPETALARRARELFAMPGNNTKEREAIHRALHTLEALSFCLKLETSYGDDRQKRAVR